MDIAREGGDSVMEEIIRIITRMESLEKKGG